MKNNNRPLVTVIVPSYNHKNYIKETIESIINQTYNNLELIVIDDGSSDNSVEIIQKLANKYEFTFLHRANKGVSATLNECISLSTGKYICACASDDIYSLDKIEKQVKFMEENTEYAMCYGNIIQFDINGNNKKSKVKKPKSGFIFDDLIFSCFIPATTTFMKSEVLKELNGFDEKSWMEDWDMWLKISKKYKIGYIDEYLTYYRKHDTNISSNTLKMYEAGEYILDKYKSERNYLAAKIDRDNRYFYLLSRKHKKEAIKLLPTTLTSYLNPKVIVGLLKLIFLR